MIIREILSEIVEDLRSTLVRLEPDAQFDVRQASFQGRQCE